MKRENGKYRINTQYGTFEADNKLDLMMQYNTARYRAEQAEAHRQMRLEEQRAVLEFNEARRGG